MNKLQENLDKYKDNLEEVILLSKRKKKEIEEELYFELLEKYARLAHEDVIDKGRVYARDNKLRRPWDGRNGKFYKQWLKEQADLMALITAGGGDDSDSDSSTGQTPRDILVSKPELIHSKLNLNGISTKILWKRKLRKRKGWLELPRKRQKPKGAHLLKLLERSLMKAAVATTRMMLMTTRI